MLIYPTFGILYTDVEFVCLFAYHILLKVRLILKLIVMLRKWMALLYTSVVVNLLFMDGF